MTTDGYDKTYDGIPEVRVEGDDDVEEGRGVTMTASTDYGSISTHHFLLQSRSSGMPTKNPINKRKKRMPDD